MSAPSKSNDKNKRYPGIKPNDFVNKTKTNETSRATARTQGWTNLGKISSRRVPPPANVPSLKSETGTIPPTFDPILPTGTIHGWTASGNQTPTTIQQRPLTPSKQPTQQQLDSLPAHSSTPPPSSSSTDIDKPRLQTTWSTVTAGATSNSNDQPPNLLGLNDFPRLVTQDNNNTTTTNNNNSNNNNNIKNSKSPSDSVIGSLSTNTQGPIFRPANLASWKEGGGRAQPISNDSNDNNNNNNNLSIQPQVLTTNTNSQIQNPNNSSYMRMYQQQQQPSAQMWSYNLGNSYSSYGPNPTPSSMSMHPQQQQQRVSSYNSNNQSQRHNQTTDYKTPTILRNKDIDDLSKLTDNVTWANASQEVNYQEKIQFSDDEDNDLKDNKSRRFNNKTNSQHQHQHQHQQTRQTYPQVLQNTNRTRSRLLQDDEHVKQMQDDKNSELINTLTVAKQRRDEQERHLRDQKQIPGYQTRPLLPSTGQENLSSTQTDSSSSWGQTNPAPSASSTTTTSRTRHDTTDSQSFTMKSWSDQMETFNYASLHEKSGGQGDIDDHNDDTTNTSTQRTRKYSGSPSESSSQSQTDTLTKNRSKHLSIKQRLPNTNIKSKTTDVIDYFDNNNNNDQQMRSNDQWGDWEDTNYSTNNRYQQQYTNDRRRHQQQQQQQSSDNQRSYRSNEQINDYNRTKQPTKTRTNVTSRSSDIQPSSTTKSDNSKPVTNKIQQAPWRALSPTRPPDSNDPTPQEAISYKSQIKTNNDISDRRQSAPTERKQRYATTTPINTSSIPPLMSVRSDVPPTISTTSTAATTKNLKTSNQSQRQDYSNSSHYSQRNDFYNDTNDSAWGNDDEYYDDDTGYYDPNIPTHQRHHHSMAYQSHLHHRGYIALGSYGRYRRGGTLRHQQQYNTYNINNQSGASSSSSQLNTSTGSKAKKILTNRTVSSSSTSTTNKKPNQTTSTDQPKPIEEPVKNVSDESVKKPSVWSTEPKSTVVEEIPIIKSVETPTVPTVIEKPKETIIPEQKTESESNIVPQIETESATTATTNKKSTANNSQRKTNYNQDQHYQDQHYQNQQTTRHRNTYTRSMQDYESMQMAAHTYFGTNRRTTRGGRTTRMHDLSSGYYYEHPQQRYNNRYSYSTDPYQQSHSTRSTFKTKKRGASTTATTTTDHQQNKQQTASGNNTNNNNLQHQSVSDNEQKEGEEWETASESSANMRHNPPQINKITTHETNTTKRERTPPKKSFSSQRPLNTRSNDITVRRSHNLYERGSKSTRGVRTSRLTTTQKQTSPQKSELELAKQMKKDPHRHSLDGYDLNNVAGVVKIETLPAGALEEESTAFDDGGEEFCVVMSKRGRKEQKAAQLSKQIAVEVPVEQPVKSTSIDNDEQQTNEKTSNETNSTRPRNGKSLPPRFNSKTSSSTTRQSKGDHQNYYDQGYYYYYDQNTYYDHDGSYYNYNNYNQSHRQTSTRRKQQPQQQQPQPQPTTRNQQSQQQQPETNVTTDEKKVDTEKNPSNVMSNIQMWNPHTDNTISNSSKLIEKPTHDRKFANDIVSTNDASLPLHQRTATELPTHSPVSKTNETIARTIKPPMTDNKSDRDAKTKSASYEKNDTMSSLGSNQLFEKSTFLDYDDKQSIGTVGDDYNQKINSLKTIWDISDHPSGQLEQTINSMVAMQQQKQQDTNVQSNNSTKSDNYVQEPISTSSANPNVTSTANDDTNTKNSSTNPNIPTNPSVSTHNQSATYSTNTNSNKNEAKNICTVKPTQQVPPNIQDQVDVSPYQTFAAPPLLPPMSQASLQQQHILPQSQVNPVHQQHSYTFYENLMAPPQQQPPPPPPQQQQQPPFNRIYPSTTNSTNNDPINSDFSSIQYPPQNFPYRNTNVFMPPTNVPNTGSMYHHTSQGSISAPPQNNTMPPPPQMPSYPPQFLVDHGGHMISQAQAPPPPTQPYMNNQMMSGRPQGGPFYRTAPQQQLQTPPGPPPYGTQDPLAHGGYYQPFFPPPNSNAPPVGHPSAHNLYGQNENFHPPPPHPQMFPRGGSMDRTDHPLMSQPLSRPTNYPSQSSNQQQAPPPSLLSKNFPSFHTNQQQTSSSNQAQAYYPPPNQYNRQSVPIGAMNPTNNRQPNQPVPSLMSGLTKNFPNNGNNLNNNPSSLAYRQPLITPQTNNNNNNPNRSSYQPHPQYPTYSKSTPSNDDNVKPKHI